MVFFPFFLISWRTLRIFFPKNWLMNSPVFRLAAARLSPSLPAFAFPGGWPALNRSGASEPRVPTLTWVCAQPCVPTCSWRHSGPHPTGSETPCSRVLCLFWFFVHYWLSRPLCDSRVRFLHCSIWYHLHYLHLWFPVQPWTEHTKVKHRTPRVHGRPDLLRRDIHTARQPPTGRAPSSFSLPPPSSLFNLSYSSYFHWILLTVHFSWHHLQACVLEQGNLFHSYSLW